MRKTARLAIALVLCTVLACAAPHIAAAPEQTELQAYWNRPWYGILYVENANGSFAEAKHMDLHMTVEADADGEAVLCLYIDPDEKPFAAARGTVTMEGFTTESGMVLDRNVGQEYKLVGTNYQDMYALMHTYTAPDGSVLEYLVYVKPWGETWEDAVKAGHVVPPGYHLSYEEALSEGMMSPVAGR